MEQLPLACDASRDKESRHEPVARFFDEVVLSCRAFAMSNSKVQWESKTQGTRHRATQK